MSRSNDRTEVRGLTGRRVLVVDDDDAVRDSLFRLLESEGARVVTSNSGRQAYELLESGLRPHAILLDTRMPGFSGCETLKRIGTFLDASAVVLLSDGEDGDEVLEGMRLGATSCIAKPVGADEVLDALMRIVGEADPVMPVPVSRRRAAEPAEPSPEPGEAMRKVEKLIDSVADTDVTVLLRGETGVGKGYIARRLHDASPRARRPFVTVHCAALPTQLLESELFGYEQGAFTGAWRRKPGKFELARGGTVFLDEIAEMSPELQAKLLQVLQDGTFSPIGGNKQVRVDCRMVCATHRDLVELVARREFREDLYFRVNVVDVEIPPLRARRTEIPALFRHFVESYCKRTGRAVPPLDPRLTERLQAHPFPGNVRELENLAKRVVVLGASERMLSQLGRDARPIKRSAEESLEKAVRHAEETAGMLPLLEVRRRAIEAVESEVIGGMLERTGWNRKQVSRLLGVSYTTLLKKIRDYGIEDDTAPHRDSGRRPESSIAKH